MSDPFKELLDSIFAGLSEGFADARERLVNEPWYGKELDQERGSPGQPARQDRGSEPDLGWVRWKESEPEPDRQPHAPDPERGHDR